MLLWLGQRLRCVLYNTIEPFWRSSLHGLLNGQRKYIRRDLCFLAVVLLYRLKPLYPSPGHNSPYEDSLLVFLLSM
jgi:hypothetical protein